MSLFYPDAIMHQQATSYEIFSWAIQLRRLFELPQRPGWLVGLDRVRCVPACSRMALPTPHAQEDQ